MYETKKYLKIERETLKVLKSVDFGERSDNIYEVVHLKPFNYSVDNVNKFIDIIFQGFLNVSNYSILYTECRGDEVETIEVSIKLNGVKFSFTFRDDNFLEITSHYKFKLELNLNHNKNNLTILKLMFKEVNSLTDWVFIKSKIIEKLSIEFPNESEFHVGGFIRRKSEDSDEEIGEFVVTPNSSGDVGSYIKNISFKLYDNDLKVNNLSIQKSPSSLNKDIEYYKKEIDLLNKSVRIGDLIYEEVRWVVFSSRREERLRKLLDK